jgi:hypothetical protein
MSNRENQAFPELVLGLSERIQRSFGHTVLGSRLIRTFAGSTSPNYIQADWYSELSFSGMTTDVKNTVTVTGDRISGRLPRHWLTAMVMATTSEELESLREETATHGQQEAVAYIADDIVHVGVDPNRASLPLFGRLAMSNDNEHVIAMRKSQKPLQATMGLWLPAERAFVGVETLHIINEEVAVNQFSPLSEQLSQVPIL